MKFLLPILEKIIIEYLLASFLECDPYLEGSTYFEGSTMVRTTIEVRTSKEVQWSVLQSKYMGLGLALSTGLLTAG